MTTKSYLNPPATSSPPDLPPPPPCQHKFVHLDTTKKDDFGNGYNIHYIRIDRFFCEKCLEEKEIVKDDYSREAPDWY